VSESTVLILIVAAGLMLLIGVKNPVKLVLYLFLTWLLVEVFVADHPTRAAAAVRAGVHDLVRFLKAVT
jgi:hypothetical protein